MGFLESFPYFYFFFADLIYDNRVVYLQDSFSEILKYHALSA